MMKTFYKKIKFISPLLLLLLFVQPASAQSEGMNSQEMLLIFILGLVLLVAVLVLIVALYLIVVIRSIMDKETSTKAKSAEVVQVEKKPSWWAQMQKKMTRAVPIEKEEDIVLDHNYDGIRELDNHLPPWWKWLFNFTIIVSVIYLLVYHVFDAFPLSHEEYAIEMEEAEEAQAALAATGTVETIDLSNPQLSDDPEHIAKGKSIFNINCSSCHAADGGGGIGPNLTDKYWLHGGDFTSIFNTVYDGVDGTSMIAWKNVLSPVQVRDVSSYVNSLIGTMPVNRKEPEGEEFLPIRDEVETAPDSVDEPSE